MKNRITIDAGGIMMSSNSHIQLRQYVVSKIQFDLKSTFDGKNQRGIKIDPLFRRDVTTIDPEQFQINIGCSIDCELFFLNLELNGIFSCKDWSSDLHLKEMIIVNTTAILFPYLRNAISSITLNANIPPYTLPVMNVVELFKEKK
jgi:preprotein translocase subunit SecB